MARFYERERGPNGPYLETGREGGVTALIGLSEQRGAFGRDVVEAVDRNTPVPIVFVLSKPTRHAEAAPADVLDRAEGRALVATARRVSDDMLSAAAGVMWTPTYLPLRRSR